MKTRQLIKATLTVEVDAESAEDAYERFSDGLDEIPGLVDITVHQVEQTEKPYEIPPGTERWAAAAKDVRFGEGYQNVGYGRRIWAQHDGSWWWTNGHVMLRCEGPSPTDEDLWRQVPEKEILKAVAPKKKRAPGELQRCKTHRGKVVYRSTGAPPITIDGEYHHLASAQVVTWMIPDVDLVPLHGLGADGRLMAVVMPMRIEGHEVSPDTSAPAQEKGNGE